ncbi:MAG TPA: MmcQ/YjbR family DNA-binding protein [Actinomycetota bacterium]|nr:MmcQ/YjbR family DNA-binding protein [Actinomycetota bacterium]
MRVPTVRKLALALPGTVEKETWETPTFRVRNKIFAMLAESGREIWIKSTHDEQRALTQMDPETFSVPPYVGPSGWIGARLATVDRDELAELLTEAWRLTAGKRAVDAFDAAQDAS